MKAKEKRNQNISDHKYTKQKVKQNHKPKCKETSAYCLITPLRSNSFFPSLLISLPTKYFCLARLARCFSR